MTFRLVVSFILLFLAVLAEEDYPDYYWRPYSGIVPKDAVVATSDHIVPTFIGNVYVHDVGILVGQLVGGRVNITVTGGVEKYREVYNRQSNVKILCTDRPDKLEWVQTNRTGFSSLKRQFVVAGQQARIEGNLYVGRIDFQGLRIGKVDGYYDKFVDIYFVYNGEEITTASNETLQNDSFEVLAYNPEPFSGRGNVKTMQELSVLG